jgi:hypothetical protein
MADERERHMPNEKAEWASGLDESAADRPEDVPLKPHWFPRTLIEQVEIFAKITLIVGALIAAREYFDQRSDMRVARSLEFVLRFDNPEYLGPRQAVGRALSQKARELRDGATDASEGEPDPALIKARAEQAAMSIVLDGNDGKGLESEVGQIAGFFSSLQICIERTICDADTAHAVFDSYARSFWRNFRPYFEDAQTMAPEAGRGLQKFVTASGG